MPEDDYETNFETCPHCGHHGTRYRDCTRIGCDDGFIDEYEDDSLWFNPGDISKCGECKGSGSIQWCPSCGKDPRDNVAA